MIDGIFRQNLEETGMAYSLEVAMIAEARKMELLTTPYVFTPENAHDMARAGADVLVCHMGLTTSGAIGAQTAKTLDQCIEEIARFAAAASKIRDDIIVLCHGGPIANPEDAEYVLGRCPACHGFFGASSMERLPTEQAIVTQTRAFKKIGLTTRRSAAAQA
jgi:predicted TIM-barrel enzyme